MRRQLGAIAGVLFTVIFLLASSAEAARFRSAWPEQATRLWPGPQYWSNPLQDWRIHAGRLECREAAADRNVHLLTHRVGQGEGEFEMEVRVGALDPQPRGTAGFRLGVRGPLDDYRNALLFGKGIDAGLSSDGTLFLGNATEPLAEEATAVLQEVRLRLSAKPSGQRYQVVLAAHNADTGGELGRVQKRFDAEALAGNVALVCNARQPQQEGGAGRYWFEDWKVFGDRIEAHPEDAFGPILFAMHTLSQGVMKMTAQMPPLGDQDSKKVRLEIRPQDDSDWQPVGEAEIDPLSRTATFRVPDWDADRDVPYRLVYCMTDADGSQKDHHYEGTVRRDPVDKESIVVAGFTGHQDYLFPNSLMASNVEKLDPDVLVFTGDQLYEGNARYGFVREPVEVAAVDYLRKWYVFGWGFRDLMRDRPTLCLPDDHDVYQGNIWGHGGRDCGGIRNHAQGGYAMDPEWVNAIQRTQTSHHPDPYDPTPVKQDITVYYGPMVYGRISFAVLEDRKFKSGPEGKVNTWPGRPDHVKDPEIDPESLDKPGLKLLGDRQLEFLRDWSADWAGADMKLAVSQTIFANVANYHGAAQEYLVADLDSNGWPQSGRNRALRELRRAFALHLAGDQHLASIVHHGVDEWRDSIFSFCVPSIAAGYPRSWHPEREGKVGKNREPGMPESTGDFLDGLGNHVTVYAVGNPEPEQRRDPLGRGHDKASGFGIVRLDKSTREITMECWRLLVDTADPKPGDQFPGFPMTIDQQDNYGREPLAHLPKIAVQGMTDPVVQVIDENRDEVVYTLRIKGTEFRPKIFQEGPHTLRVGNLDSDQWKTIESVESSEDGTLDVEF